jgi:uncharacterized protein YbbK (DUF523 family)
LEKNMVILVSACLLGTACRYDGASRPCEAVIALKQKHTVIPVCPEVLGGLPTPRIPAERVDDRVVRRDGVDVSAEYERGAREVLRLAQLNGARVAILKEKSPACGSGQIYDGSFTATLTDGDGVCAALLKEHGIRVLGESELGLFDGENEA